MATLDLTHPHQRALGDLLQAERDLRQKSEDTVRDMRQVLLETANRFDGQRLESLRRTDPCIPANWGAADWKKFFSEVPVLSKGWDNAAPSDMKAQRELGQQVEALKAALKSVQATLELERARTEAAETKSETQMQTAGAKALSPAQPMASAQPAAGTDVIDLPPEATPALSLLIQDTRQAMQTFPQKPPASLSSMLSGGGRSGGDLMRAYQRYFVVLYLIGHWRLAASMEIEEILANAVSVSAGAGSLQRVMNDLNSAGILLSEVLHLSSPHTALKLVRFSEQGGKLYQALFQKRPFENEWARLIRLHEGERFPEQTAAMILFVMHARKRGWAAQVLPEINNSKAMPDAWIGRGAERLYIEVELSGKERLSKWRNQAALNAGRTALCAANQKSRVQLVDECKLDQLPGMATDLEYLVKGKFKEISADTLLWLENW